MWKKSKSLSLSKITTILFLVLLIAASLFLPAIVRQYILLRNENTALFLPLLITVYTSVPFAGGLLVCLYCLLHNIGKNNIFTDKNVTFLRIASWCCFAAAIIYGVCSFRYLPAILISLAAAFMGLILRVIKNVFEQAIMIKNENDYTI